MYSIPDTCVWVATCFGISNYNTMRQQDGICSCENDTNLMLSCKDWPIVTCFIWLCYDFYYSFYFLMLLLSSSFMLKHFWIFLHKYFMNSMKKKKSSLQKLWTCKLWIVLCSALSIVSQGISATSSYIHKNELGSLDNSLHLNRMVWSEIRPILANMGFAS